MRLVFSLSLFIYAKDTAQFGEASSLYVLIDVVIYLLGDCDGNKKPWQVARTSCLGRVMIAYPL
jgi:hypothetical protein